MFFNRNILNTRGSFFELDNLFFNRKECLDLIFWVISGINLPDYDRDLILTL